MITISWFTDRYTQAVIDLALHFQNDGTRPPVSVADQPDLLQIEESYIKPGGDFWVATDDGRLIGTIGLMPHGDGIAILKKFFVYEAYQGAPHHLGQKLFAALLAFAKESGVKTILLDTPYNTVRAHKFYEKAGFRQISEEELPFSFSHPIKACDFFMLTL